MATARQTVGFALLLSVPPGLGVTAAVSMRAGGGALTPLALGAGAITFVALFLLVVAGASGDAAAGESGPQEGER